MRMRLKMVWQFLRDLAEAVSRREEGQSYDARLLPRFGWQCECGGKSRRPGFLSSLDAEYAAQRHQWHKGVGHPMPELIPEDAPGL